MLNQVNRCIANLKPDITDKIKENIFKAQGKCNRMIKASTELDVKTLFEAKDSVAKYTENSVKIYKLSVSAGVKLEKKKKVEAALLIASTVASEKQPENTPAKTNPAVLERIEELCSEIDALKKKVEKHSKKLRKMRKYMRGKSPMKG